jgi:hypothetical protein
MTLSAAFTASGADLLVPQKYPTIQLALNAAASGDRVLLAEGQYEGTLDLLAKSVTIQGAGTAAQTVLRPGAGTSLISLATEEASPCFRNLTITGGATVRPVQITGGSPLFERCIFSNNANGAIVDGRSCASNDGSTYRDCLFIGNSSPNGGAIYLYSTNARFFGCAFVRNIAQGPTGGVNAGGSVYVNDWDCGRHVFAFNDCTFAKGSAVWGGAIYSQGTYPNSPTVMGIERCVFWNLEASDGSAMWNWYITVPVSMTSLCGASPIGYSWSDAGGNTFLPACGPIPPYADCDSDDIPDDLAATLGLVPDSNADGIPDTCQCSTIPSLPTCCAGDLDHDSTVGGADIGLLLSNWGPCGSACLYDLNNDGKVNGGDLGLLLAGWGPCSN